jgi:hypothetical protein
MLKKNSKKTYLIRKINGWGSGVKVVRKDGKKLIYFPILYSNYSAYYLKFVIKLI